RSRYRPVRDDSRREVTRGYRVLAKRLGRSLWQAPATREGLTMGKKAPESLWKRAKRVFEEAELLDVEMDLIIDELAEAYHPPGIPACAFRSDIASRYKNPVNALKAMIDWSLQNAQYEKALEHEVPAR